jgi:translocation and assembly module TamB
VNSGRVIFPFGTLEMDQAYASLDSENTRGPNLFLHASGRNYRYDIRLEVTGPVDGASILFTSTPPLTSEEILLMLTAGEMPKTDNIFSTGARAGQLATFLGRGMVSRFLGGDSSKERLIINTSENITDEGRTTYSVEYRLTNRWSLVGEYDRFSELNAAVKWRILSR